MINNVNVLCKFTNQSILQLICNVICEYWDQTLVKTNIFVVDPTILWKDFLGSNKTQYLSLRVRWCVVLYIVRQARVFKVFATCHLERNYCTNLKHKLWLLNNYIMWPEGELDKNIKYLRKRFWNIRLMETLYSCILIFWNLNKSFK